jgi:hypothetical protein
MKRLKGQTRIVHSRREWNNSNSVLWLRFLHWFLTSYVWRLLSRYVLEFTRCGSLFSSRNVKMRNERWHLAKVAPVLPTTSRRHTKGVYVKLHAFLMCDLCGVEWSAFGPGLIDTGRQTAVGQSRAIFEVFTATDYLVHSGFDAEVFLDMTSCIFLKADSHIPCRSHADPLPLPCHSPTVLCPSWKFLFLCMKFSCCLHPGTIFY